VKISRIYTFIAVFAFSLLLVACGGSSDGSSSSTTSSSANTTSSVGIPAQLSQGLASLGKPATVISSSNQQNQLATTLGGNGVVSPTAIVNNPAAQFETTLNQLSSPSK
jgi:hypothetical protein